MSVNTCTQHKIFKNMNFGNSKSNIYNPNLENFNGHLIKFKLAVLKVAFTCKYQLENFHLTPKIRWQYI